MTGNALTQLLHGQGAHVDPLVCIEDLDAPVASQHIPNFPHSITDLVFHMNYWMNYELKRIRGQKPQFPEHNAESFPTTPQNWDQLRRDFSWFLQEYSKLAESSPQELARHIESIHEGDKKVASTLEAIVSQMIAHNSYHPGQIAMIRRGLNAWPPKSGSDTW